ncbi:cytochrome P450 CYP72A616-like [Solanum dulcamara]|uniref:cytochrome P450 CYP72A616-like n=1 Tax=Solanum dulcamara TaxID=45834 RepID=UPI002486B0EA|nr:cytochrome P450 CYP72A616-like [Solanum dulcamara]
MAAATIIAAIVGILVACFCGKVLYTIWWWPKMIEKKLKKEGIHGEPYKLLFGNLKEMMKMSREAKKKPLLDHDIIPWVNPFLLHLSNTYKKIFVLWAGPTPRVTVTDPKLIREVLNRYNEFHKPEANAFVHLFVTGLASYDGEKWDTHRKILNPAFHVEKLKRMFPAISVCCDEMINRWEELVSKKGSCELDVADEFLNLGGDVISRAAFGSNIEEGRSIFLLQKEQCELILASPFTLFFPSLRFLPTASNKKAKYIHKKVISIIRGIIEKREEALRRGLLGNDDILGLLLKARNEENKSKAGRGSLSTGDVIEECKEFYFAGQDTTTALLSWTLVVLSMHPEWQDKARNEVFQVIGKNKPKFDDLNQLKIMNMIFQEVLRLYPAIFLIRSTSKDTKLGDMTIPSGVQVCVPTHLIHRDPEVWGDDVLMFNPERFSEGVTKAAKEQLYFPFGWGARMCIGLNFGMLEAKLIFAQILQHFWFELSPSYTHAPQLTLIMKPQYGAQIIVHKL